MRSVLLICCFIVLTTGIFSQNYWTPIAENQIPLNGPRRITPDKYAPLALDTALMLQILREAPHERQVSPYASLAMLEVPVPNGEMQTFRIVRYDMMEPGLADRYPGIMTFLGVGTGREPQYIRLDWTARGFHATFTTPRGKVYIDPYCFDNVLHYVSYYTTDYPEPATPFECHFSKENNLGINEPSDGELKAGDCVFRSYRLAMATTGEYSNYHGADNPSESALVLSAVVTAVNRVNEVYERDATIRMILIANTDDVFYYNPATDPYTNSSGGTMLGENQTTLDAVIGTANYDMGHVFSTGGGGVANLNAPCDPNLKARGVTGLGNPIGDPFYIDYVAHEMGHQFGANHTQNNDCNRVPATAMEPGSASTIMGYAGICSPNVQSNSDDYFHAISLQEIGNFVAFGSGNSCDTPLPFVNNPPTVGAGNDRIIPVSTPFMLTASANDPDGHPLTYCWEQWDNEAGDMPPQTTNTQGPMFRTFDPNSSATRYFPRLQDLVNNVSPTWEVLPSVGRDMEFRVTVRDNNGAAGCTAEDNMTVTTAAGIGPFLVTAPNTGSTVWTEGQFEQVTWNVVNTTTAPVSCSLVDIFLSYDGGFTYPAQLANNLPNNGVASVLVPAGTTTTARVMVKAEGNIFFDISNANFTIVAGAADFSVGATPVSITACPPNDAVYTINTGSFGGFSGNVTLSLTGAPMGTTHTFSVNPVIAGNSSTLTIGNLAALAPGAYNMEVWGSGSTGLRSIAIELNVSEYPGIPSGITPANGATDHTIVPVFTWSTSSNTIQYSVELSSSPVFSTISASTTTAGTTWSPELELQPLTTYYWRVRGMNTCGNGNWSAVSSFTTVPCFTYTSANVPVTIPSSGSPTVTSTLNITDAGIATDLNVVNLSGTHTWINDLAIDLIGPDNTTVTLFAQICDDEDNFNINFSDQAASSNYPCPPTDGGAYRPQNPLSPFNNKSITGIWTLRVRDLFNQDGGQLQSWGIRVCPSGSSLLPVEWLSFYVLALEDHGSIRLNWATAAEFNNAGFQIERKTDNESEFATIAWIDSKGNEGVSQHYEWTDLSAQRGLRYYYRLRQLDYDGKESYSPVRTAELTSSDDECRLTWLPAQNMLLLGCPERTTSPATCIIYNMQGQQLSSINIGTDTHSLNLDELPSGVYLAVIITGAHRASMRIAK